MADVSFGMGNESYRVGDESCGMKDGSFGNPTMWGRRWKLWDG